MIMSPKNDPLNLSNVKAGTNISQIYNFIIFSRFSIRNILCLNKHLSLPLGPNIIIHFIL